jgi:hypothetical protein
MEKKISQCARRFVLAFPGGRPSTPESRTRIEKVRHKRRDYRRQVFQRVPKNVQESSLQMSFECECHRCPSGMFLWTRREENDAKYGLRGDWERPVTMPALFTTPHTKGLTSSLMRLKEEARQV